MRDLITRIRNTVYWKRCGHGWKYAWQLAGRTL